MPNFGIQSETLGRHIVERIFLVDVQLIGKQKICCNFGVCYDLSTKTWKRVTDNPLLDDEGLEVSTCSQVCPPTKQPYCFYFRVLCICLLKRPRKRVETWLLNFFQPGELSARTEDSATIARRPRRQYLFVYFQEYV